MGSNDMIELLYKYTHPRNWCRFFGKENWSIRFTPPKELNDPYDCYPYVYDDNSELDIEELKKIERDIEYYKILEEQYSVIPNKKMSYDDFIKYVNENYDYILKALISNKKLYKKYAKETIDYMVSNYGVLSLTDSHDNVLMWSHYADSHKGFVIGIDRNAKVIRDKLREVKYTSIRPKISYQEILRDKYDFSIKSSVWSYEKEFRAVTNLNYSPEIDWIDIKNGIAKLDKNIVCSITFGAAMTETEVDDKCKEIRSQKDCEHITLQQAYLDDSEFKLNIKNINI